MKYGRGELRTYVEVELGRIEKNYRAVMGCLSGGARAIAVVKSNAYGHGDVAVARRLCRAGVRRFAVSNLDEARALRSCAELRGSEVLILGYTPPCAAEELAALGISQTLLSAEYARELAENAKRCGVRVRCHLAVDTGMRRIGVDSADTESIEAILLQSVGQLDITAAFTHLSSADGNSEADESFTKEQLLRFYRLSELLRRLGVYELHCLNSAGILRYGRECDERLSRLVRPGLALYGLLPCSAPLVGVVPVLSWRSVVAMVKDVSRGACIGYGRSYVTGSAARIATVPIGYADGYPRSLSDGSFVLIRGKRAEVVGRVCMNQITVDVSGIEGVAAGDSVTLIGRDGDEAVSADMLAAVSRTISYEILCGIDRLIPRIYTG